MPRSKVRKGNKRFILARERSQYFLDFMPEQVYGLGGGGPWANLIPRIQVMRPSSYLFWGLLKVAKLGRRSFRQNGEERLRGRPFRPGGSVLEKFRCRKQPTKGISRMTL